MPLTLVLQAPTEDALRQLMNDLPTFTVALERTGCHVSVVADSGVRQLGEFVNPDDTVGRG